MRRFTFVRRMCPARRGDGLASNRCIVTMYRIAPQVCGQQKIVRRAASRAKYDGRFPDRWWQVWWQRWGIKGTRGDRPVSSFSNLLIILIHILIPPFGGSNPSTPAKFVFSFLYKQLAAGYATRRRRR